MAEFGLDDEGAPCVGLLPISASGRIAAAKVTDHSAKVRDAVDRLARVEAEARARPTAENRMLNWLEKTSFYSYYFFSLCCCRWWSIGYLSWKNGVSFRRTAAT